MKNKVLVLGIDGFDPRFAKFMLDEGKMPALKAFVEKGSAREDLVLLGALPTITPPLWTTLATGTYPGTHGITCFWRQDTEDLGRLVYNLDSRLCKAEPIWDSAVKSGLSTLVWHWPGSSWPPSSDSPLLHVVDGTQPAAVNKGVATIDGDKIIVASTEFTTLKHIPQTINDTGAGCIIEDLDVALEKSLNNPTAKKRKVLGGLGSSVKSVENLILSRADEEVEVMGAGFYSVTNSPIQEANGWADAPRGAKEFSVLISNGLERRPCLILPNQEGIYDRIALYKNKKQEQPLVICGIDEFVANFQDEAKKDEKTHRVNRHIRLLDLSPDGNNLRLWLGGALDMENDTLFHPKSLYGDVVSNVGLVPPISTMGGINHEYVQKIFLRCWDEHVQWQGEALSYLAKTGNYDFIISHLHNVDNIGHQLWHYAKHHDRFANDESAYQPYLIYCYQQTDAYLAKFLPLLDEGWTIFIVSDHGLITTEKDSPLIGEPAGISVRVMEELGYTTLKKDEAGMELKEIDWSKTKAIASRTCHIWLNLKGRNPEGIVEPSDKYALEKEVIDSLYNYRDEQGERVIALALRNKDAVLLGVSGEECGDIVYFLEEGVNRVHGDSLSTQTGYFHTSVSPIFIAAGQGIKANYAIERMIRQVDVAPTIATLLKTAMPEQCEGAPIYQIFVS